MMVSHILIITPEEEKFMKSKFERNESEIENDIANIKEWLKKQLHLPHDIEDVRIKNTLLLNKCSLEKTKRKLDLYYSLKHVVPEIYDNWEPLQSSISTHMDLLALFPLPRLTPACHRIFIARLLNDDASKFDINIYFKTLFSLFDVLLMEDLSLGNHFIVDYDKYTLAHIVQVTPTILKKTNSLFMSAYSARIKGLHFINMPPSANYLVNIFKSVLSEKLAKRIIVHKNVKSLDKVFPKELLPIEYGGKAGAINDLNEQWKKYLCSKNAWIKEMGIKRSDESKRIGDQLDPDFTGVCGSFRKLNVD